MWEYIYNEFLFLIYLFFLEISPLWAYLYNCIRWHNSLWYIWSDICLKFAGCNVIFLENSNDLAIYEPNGCLFLSTGIEHIYTNIIDTYLTHGWAIIITPYSYITYWLNQKYIIYHANDVISTVANSGNNNIVVYPDLDDNNNRLSIFIQLAWATQKTIQFIVVHNKEAVIDIKKREANYGINIYCYRSKAIRPYYFNTFEEFAEYVKLIWLDILQ